MVSEIIDLYNSGMSSDKMGKLYNLSRMYILNLLRSNNCYIKNYSDLNKKYKINESIFDNISSEESAYFLGFLFSDGNVSTKNNTIRLKLNNRDEGILLRLSNIISPNKPLYKSDNNLILQFSSEHIKTRLIELGCVPNKSLKITYPNLENCDNHFIRGYFDGDGSIVRYKNDFSITIISTESFCKSIENIIYDKFKIHGSLNKSKYKNNITTVFRYTGNRRVEKIMSWLYEDATIYLYRKYNRYLELKKWISEVDSRKIKK